MSLPTLHGGGESKEASDLVKEVSGELNSVSYLFLSLNKKRRIKTKGISISRNLNYLMAEKYVHKEMYEDESGLFLRLTDKGYIAFIDQYFLHKSGKYVRVAIRDICMLLVAFATIIALGKSDDLVKIERDINTQSLQLYKMQTLDSIKYLQQKKEFELLHREDSAFRDSLHLHIKQHNTGKK
jgi:hypothetical protein